MADIITQTNQNLIGSFNMGSIMNTVGWLIAVVIIFCLIGGFIWWYYTNKLFNRKITRFEMIGDAFTPTFRDKAKLVKLGSGGFQVLYYQKAKIYRIAYGNRIGKNDYYMFVAPDGYEYNGFLGNQITKDGRIPVVTTNPSMRAQYTALEKQIEALHGEKPKFWDKYGNWIMSLAFILIIGVLSWLSLKELNTVTSANANMLQKLTELTGNIDKLLISTQSVGQTARLS